MARRVTGGLINGSSSGVVVQIDSSDLTEKFRRLSESLESMSPVWSVIGEIVSKSIDQNFVDQGRPTKWKPLSDRYLLQRAGGVRRLVTKRGKVRKHTARKIYGIKTLIRTSRLRNSINYRASQSNVVVGTSGVEYAAAHQWGNPETNLPARPYVMVQDEDWPIIERAIDEFMAQAFG